MSDRLTGLRRERALAAAAGDFAMPRSLRSERLLLGQPGPDHLEPFIRFWTDPVCARYMGGVRDRLGAWRVLAASCGAWVLHGFGPYAVQSGADGAFLGWIGLWFPDDMPEIELDYALMPSARGNGYAVEGVRAVADEAVRRGVPSLISLIHPDNEASQHVAARAGASHDRVVTRRGEVQQLWRYSVPADEALARAVADAAADA